MTMFRPKGPMLHPRVAVLRRPGGAVQLGWDPERAVVLEPAGVRPEVVVEFLRLLDGLRSHPDVVWQADRLGVGAEVTLQLLAEIDAAGLLLLPEAGPARVRTVHVHGRGPLSEAVVAGVRRLGLRPTRTRELDGAEAAIRGADLVLLTDLLVPEPQLVSELVLRRIPHLQVRVRDGRGIVGPLVLPGGTSCLRCADLIRNDLDEQWPHLAAQLLGRVGYATPATVTATAALALRELEVILAGRVARPPETLDATLELDPDSHRIRSRRWRPHRACGCRALTGSTP